MLLLRQLAMRPPPITPVSYTHLTLALMIAQAANCINPAELESRATGELPDFCGECPNCVRIAAAAPLSARFEEAVAVREELSLIHI